MAFRPGVVVEQLIHPKSGHTMTDSADVARLRSELARRDAARDSAIAWREAAMRAQLEQVPPGATIPGLSARPGPHVPAPGCQRLPPGRTSLPHVWPCMPVMQRAEPVSWWQV